MKICDILLKESIFPNVAVGSKKQILEKLSEIAALKTEINQNVILDALVERERLGTTGVGHGVALPHTRLIGLDKIFCAFVKTNPVDFESVDGKTVDLIFVLLVPEEAGADHLKALSRLSKLLRDEEVAMQLRKATTAEALYNIILENDKDE